jgi:hypothetical protein
LGIFWHTSKIHWWPAEFCVKNLTSMIITMCNVLHKFLHGSKGQTAILHVCVCVCVCVCVYVYVCVCWHTSMHKYCVFVAISLLS